MKLPDLKPYAEYKDSHTPRLGNIPAHWQVRRLKRLVLNINEQTSERRPGEIYVALEHVQSWTGLLQVLENPPVFDSQVKRFVAGDILFGKLRPYLAKVTRPSRAGVCVGEFLVLRVTEDNILPEFLEYGLRSVEVIDLVNSSTFGAKMPRAEWGFIGNLLVAFPPNKDEQTRIVEVLLYVNRRLTRLIRAKQHLIDLLNEQKQAIIHRAVTRGLQPTAPLKPSGIHWIGDIPKHWEILPLRRLLVERKEKNDPIKTSNVLSLSLHAGVIPYADKRPGGNKAKQDLSAYMLAYPGDIVLNSMNVVVGSVGLSKYFGAVSPVYYMLYPCHSNDRVEYFDAIFQDQAFQRSLFGLGNGILVIPSKSTGRFNTIRMRIPMPKLGRVELPHPDSKEQADIVEYLKRTKASIDNVINKTRREVDLIREYGARLISDVLTGKVDVREVASQLPAKEECEAPVTSEAFTEDEESEPVTTEE